MRWVEVIYKCQCLPYEVSLHVREREINEDILDYMNRVQRAIGANHLSRSPLCTAATTEYVKIPVTDDGIIGGASGGTA